MKFHLNVRTDCEMIVEVEADSMQEAKDKARAAEWDEALTHWEPLGYDKVRVAWTKQIDSGADCAPSELGSQGAGAKSPAENLSRPADTAREIEAVAVAEALYGLADALALTHARQAIAALDRVRADSARGEDHWYERYREAMELMVEAQKQRDRYKDLAEQHENVWEAGHKAGRAFARGEDHRVTPEMVYEVAYGWCRKLGLPLMSPPRAPEAIDQLGREVERLRSARGEDHEEREGKAWVCMSCGFVGDRQSCGNCGAESRPVSSPVDDTVRGEDHEGIEVREAWLCPECGAENHGDVCEECGQGVAPRGEDHEDEWHYTTEKVSPNCPICGKPFGSSPVDDTVRLREALGELLDAGEPFIGDAFPTEQLNGHWLRIFNRWLAAMNDARTTLSVDAGKPEANDER